MDELPSSPRILIPYRLAELPRAVFARSHEDIPGTSDRPYSGPGVIDDVELSPQPADEHIETSIERVERTLRDTAGELLAGKNNARRFQKRFQQGELGFGQRQRGTAIPRAAHSAIDLEAVDGESPGNRAGDIVAGRDIAAAQDGPDAGYKFTRVEGLGKIIVGPFFQSHDAVIDLTA